MTCNCPYSSSSDCYKPCSDPNCVTCNKGICITCPNGLNPPCTPVIKCDIGYYDSNKEYKECLKCDILCKTCTASNVCTSCIDGYFLEGDFCTKCDDKCSKCTSLINCSACSPTYYL